MKQLFQPLIHFLLASGYFGPVLMGIADSSFLVLPLGNDLLVTALCAGGKRSLPLVVLAAATGSMIGVLLLDLVCRNLGKEGISRLLGERRFSDLERRVGKRSGIAVAFASLAPPPFPFTMVVGAASALKYSRAKLLIITWVTRVVRFTVVGLLAVKYGAAAIRISKSAPFQWIMAAFIFLCLAASVISLRRWLRSSRRR